MADELATMKEPAPWWLKLIALVGLGSGLLFLIEMARDEARYRRWRDGGG